MIKPKKPHKPRSSARRGSTQRRTEPESRHGIAGSLNLLREYGTSERIFSGGQDLFSPGTATNAVYILLDGWVFLYGILEDGRRQIVHFAMAGAVLGFSQVEGAITTFGAQALVEVTVCVIPHQALDKLSREHPEVGLQLARLLSADLGLAFEHLTSVGRQSARARVARLLLELFMRYWSVWSGNGIETMQLPLTQEHIADATGLTSVHVNRVLRRLKQDGVVEFHYRRLLILNPDKLSNVAGVDPQQAKLWLRRRPFD